MNWWWLWDWMWGLEMSSCTAELSRPNIKLRLAHKQLDKQIKPHPSPSNYYVFIQTNFGSTFDFEKTAGFANLGSHRELYSDRNCISFAEMTILSLLLSSFVFIETLPIVVLHFSFFLSFHKLKAILVDAYAVEIVPSGNDVVHVDAWTERAGCVSMSVQGVHTHNVSLKSGKICWRQKPENCISLVLCSKKISSFNQFKMEMFAYCRHSLQCKNRCEFGKTETCSKLLRNWTNFCLNQYHRRRQDRRKVQRTINF